MTIIPRKLLGDCREELPKLPAGHFHTAITSPPYWGLRSYLPADHPLKAKEIGSEPTFDLYLEHIVAAMREVRRVLRDDGSLWLNMGDSYCGNASGAPQSGLKAMSDLWSPRRNPRAHSRHQDDATIHQSKSKLSYPAGLKCKDLLLMPSRVAIALQQDGWYLRSMIPWIKRNSMPESVNDRPAAAVEYFFLLSKTDRCYYDRYAVMMPSSPGTHARVAQASLQKQTGGSKQEEYRKGVRVGKKHRDRTPADILKHMGRRAAGVGPKSAAPRSGIRNNSDFSSAVSFNIVSARNRRNSDWFMESFQGLIHDEEGNPLALLVNPVGTRIKHFASYPPKLIEPLVKATTSERGCCAACGAPYMRIVEEGASDLEHQRQCGGDANGEYNGKNQKDYQLHQAQEASTVKSRILAGMCEKRTTGWQPSCECRVGVVPCRVLDPFHGTGCTSMVAVGLGRDYTGVELNELYFKDSDIRDSQTALALL